MSISWLIILSTVGVVSLLDVILLIKHGSSSTISWTLYSGAKSYPIIGVIFGILVGHLFWVQHGG